MMMVVMMKQYSYGTEQMGSPKGPADDDDDDDDDDDEAI